MKQDEILEQESEILFQTDDKERQTELSGDESFADSSSFSTLTTTILDSFLNKKQENSVLDSFSSSASKQPLLHQDDVESIKPFLESHLKLSVPDLSFPDENRSCSISQSVFNGTIPVN